MTRQLDLAIRWSISCETSMVSVQRLLALANLPMESNPELDNAVRGGLTSEINHCRGKIEFTRVEMRYKSDL